MTTTHKTLSALWAGGRLECLSNGGRIVPIYPECGWETFNISKSAALKLFKLGFVAAEYDTNDNGTGQYAITDKGLAELDRVEKAVRS